MHDSCYDVMKSEIHQLKSRVCHLYFKNIHWHVITYKLGM